MNTRTESWIMVFIATAMIIGDVVIYRDMSLLWRIPVDFICPFGFVFLARIYHRFL